MGQPHAEPAHWVRVHCCGRGDGRQPRARDHDYDGRRKHYDPPACAGVDTTGSAQVVRRIDSRLVNEGEALGGFIVQLRGLARGDAVSENTSLREIRQAVAREALPPECATVWLDSGVYDDEAYAKFSVAPTAYDDARMRLVAAQLVAFLHNLPGFACAFIHRIGQLGIRDGGRIQGEYCLTEEDIKTGRKFPDAACRAAWPIEHWHPQQGVTLEYLPPGHTYEIPLGCLQVAGFANLWAAGKCLSAEPRAQASARVVGTCWAMGEAVGRHLVSNLDTVRGAVATWSPRAPHSGTNQVATAPCTVPELQNWTCV
ncbi:MAG: FAD-dependent oxidoreductase [Blastocatellia bacterium]